MAKKTALYDKHLELKGSMVEFAGYLLPVQYPAGLVREHREVREDVGVFDVSHMGEAVISGPESTNFLEKMLTNRIGGLAPGRMRYALMLDAAGGTLDDLLVYCFAPERYLLVLNAANREKDVAHLRAHLVPGVALEDISDATSQIALQGPRAVELLRGLMDPADIPAKYYAFTPETRVAGQPCLLSRNGYTGEDGVEIYGAHEAIRAIYAALLEKGAQPCGLGARDTLRLEAAMPLYGHELSAQRIPLGAGLEPFIKLDKDDFIGKRALEAARVTERRVGLRLTGRGIAREGCKVFCAEREVGVVTSGTQLPYLQYAACMAFVDAAEAELGRALDIDVRGRRVAAEVVALPFYRRAK